MSWLKKLLAAILAAFKPKPTPPPPSEAYVVREGERIEREVAVPFTLSFQITGVERFSGRDLIPDTTNNPDAAMLAWAYWPDWNNGKVPPVVHLRTYKLITNDGVLTERNLLEDWNPAHVYDVVFSVGKTTTTAMLTDLTDGLIWKATSIFTAPEKMRAGYGWPVSLRRGVSGAKITVVRWSDQA